MKNNRTIKVVMVDGCRDYCEAMKSFFDQKQGLEVVGIATDGVRAVEVIRESKPDVVLMDLMIPFLDGLRVLQAFKSKDEKPRFIIFTGYCTEEIINQTYELGASYFVAKPFDHSILAKRLGEFSAPWDDSQGVRMDKIDLLNNTVTDMMRDLGIPVHIKGYHYLREAIINVYANQRLLSALSKELYPIIAKKYSTTPSKVERAIRNAILLACTKGNIEQINRIFLFASGTKYGNPSNGLFIATISNRLRTQIG